MDTMSELENNNYFVKYTLRKYLAPTIISILGTTMITFVNSLLTGNMYGKEALAAMNLINPITFIFAMFGCLISIGSSTSVSIALGKEDDTQAGAYTSLALVLSILVPVIFSAAGILFFRPFLGFLGVTGEWYPIAAGYGRVILLGGVFTTFMYYPFNFLRVDGRAQYSMMIFGIMGVLDLIFVMLFHWLGLGLMGVGLAVVLSMALADALGMGILLFGKGRQLHFGAITHPIADSIEICRCGAASALNNLCNMLRTIVLNSLVLSSLGADGASMFAVACSVLNFATAFVAGAGQAVSPIVGVFYGEKDDISIRMLMKSAVRYALILMGALFVVTSLFSIPLAYAFGITTNPLRNTTALAICLIMLSLIPAAIANDLIFLYTTIGQRLLASILTFLRSFGFVALFAWMFVALGVPQWILVAFVLGEIFTLLADVPLTRIICKMNPEVDGILLLRHPEHERYVSFSVPGNAEGAVMASARMSQFCEEQEMDPRYGMMLPLALEEILVLLNEHCLNEDAGMYADVRILCNEDEVLLRIRCGGKIYDPIADYKERTRDMSEEDLLMDDSLGMHMITEAAKSVTFRRTLGVNNLVVIL